MVKCGVAPYLECSTRGDKRFSAFCARIRKRRNASIEELYQAAKVFEDGVTNLTWQEAKGLKPVNIEQVHKLYSVLWDEYINENPELLAVLKDATGVSDMFGVAGNACQAVELWRIRNSR